jgi:hypothetical protein
MYNYPAHVGTAYVRPPPNAQNFWAKIESFQTTIPGAKKNWICVSFFLDFGPRFEDNGIMVGNKTNQGTKTEVGTMKTWTTSTWTVKAENASGQTEDVTVELQTREEAEEAKKVFENQTAGYFKTLKNYRVEEKKTVHTLTDEQEEENRREEQERRDS